MSTVHLPDNLLAYIKQEAERMHHGRIIIEVNVDKPDKIDVITESRERFVPHRAIQ
jgi:hypothetical protein